MASLWPWPKHYMDGEPLQKLMAVALDAQQDDGWLGADEPFEVRAHVIYMQL